jgi:hypothetical protein
VAVGDTLHRIARTACSPDLSRRVLEPAIADLQHECAQAAGTAERTCARVSGYVAFWRTLGSCLARDAVAHESRDSLERAAAMFVIVVGAMGASEALLLHTSPNMRTAVMRALYWPPYGVYLGWSARMNAATLMFGVPFAMFPALWFASRQRTFTPGAALLMLALGTLLTIASSGWVAPAVARGDVLGQRDRSVRETGGRFYTPPIEWQLDRYPDGKAWPDLIRGAIAPPKHRYPGYPNFVAPEDRGLREWHRAVIRERLLLIVFAWIAGLTGWWLGTARLWRRGTA